MPADETASAIAAMSFETALAELEAIVDELERGQVPLERSIEIYERGQALRAQCDQLLKRAEARIEKLRLGPDGQPAGVEPLDAI